jgi:hypothetical protein
MRLKLGLWISLGACGPSRICGVRWRGQCRKPGLSSLPETAMSYGPLCQMRGMKLHHLSGTVDHWVHYTTDEISGRSTGVLYFLLKGPVSDNSPFKGQNINFHFVCVGEILRGKKKVSNHACFAHNLFVYSKCIKVGVKWATWDPVQFWRPTKICKTNWTWLKLYSLWTETFNLTSS